MNRLTMTRIEEAILSVLPPFLADEFPVSAVAEAAIRRLEVSDEEDRKRVIRDTELYLASRPDMFFNGELCFPRPAFFRGTRFRVIPSRIEIEKNILFPGARFAPFCTEDVFPDEYVLRAGETDCPIIPYTLRFSEFAPAYMLLGRAGLLDYLTAESNANWEALCTHRDPERLPMEISVFDLSEFYRKVSFQEGDSVIIEVADWTEAHFKMTYEPASQKPGREARSKFLEKFESGLLKVCENDHDSLEMPEQIARAYAAAYQAKEDLRFTPDFSLDEYPSNMLEIAIRRDGAEWSFVSSDALPDPEAEEEQAAAEEPHHHSHGHHRHGDSCFCGHEHTPENPADTPAVTDITPDQFSISSGTLESMEAILAERNAPLDSIELHSFAMDSLANGADRFEDYHTRVDSLLGITFADDAQETAFLNFLEEGFEDAQEYFNPTFEEGKAPLRARLLELCEQRVDLSLRVLEHFKNDVPHEHARSLAEFHRSVSETLSLLCADAPLPEEEENRTALEQRVEDLEDRWDELFDHFSTILMS